MDPNSMSTWLSCLYCPCLSGPGDEIHCGFCLELEHLPVHATVAVTREGDADHIVHEPIDCGLKDLLSLTPHHAQTG